MRRSVIGAYPKSDFTLIDLDDDLISMLGGNDQEDVSAEDVSFALKSPWHRGWLHLVFSCYLAWSSVAFYPRSLTSRRLLYCSRFSGSPR